MGSRIIFSIAEELCSSIETDSGPNAAESFRRCTRRFLKEYGSKHIRKLTLQDLQGFKQQLKSDGLKPKTINHYMRSVKRLVSYSIEVGYRPFLPVSAVRDIRVPVTPQDKSESPEYVRRYLEAVGKDSSTRLAGIAENLKNHLYLQYLTAMRPSELLRIVADEGVWESENVFVPTIGKTNISTRFPRRIVLTDTALSFLSRCKSHWTELSALAQACKVHAGKSCHFLRHSAAQAMADNAVPYQDVCIVLGHYNKIIGANSLHYFKPNWDDTKRALDILPWTIGLADKPKKEKARQDSPAAASSRNNEQALETGEGQARLRLVGY